MNQTIYECTCQRCKQTNTYKTKTHYEMNREMCSYCREGHSIVYKDEIGFYDWCPTCYSRRDSACKGSAYQRARKNIQYCNKCKFKVSVQTKAIDQHEEDKKIGLQQTDNGWTITCKCGVINTLPNRGYAMKIHNQGKCPTCKLKAKIDRNNALHPDKEGEVWKQIVLFPRYEVSNLGRVRRIETRQILNNQSVSQRGRYYGVNLFGGLERHQQWRYVHRLVGEAFVDNPLNLKEIDHINCDTKDNRACNLRWSSHKDNILYGRANGSWKTIRPNSKLTVKQVKEIKQSKMQTAKQLAKKYKVARATIYNIRGNYQWKDV